MPAQIIRFEVISRRTSLITIAPNIPSSFIECTKITNVEERSRNNNIDFF